MTALEPYDPRTFRALTFYDAVPHFRDGTDTPRAYLERCLETIAARGRCLQHATAQAARSKAWRGVGAVWTDGLGCVTLRTQGVSAARVSGRLAGKAGGTISSGRRIQAQLEPTQGRARDGSFYQSRVRVRRI